MYIYCTCTLYIKIYFQYTHSVCCCCCYICYIAPSRFFSWFSFHKHCWDRAAACPTQSLQNRSTGFEGMVHYFQKWGPVFFVFFFFLISFLRARVQGTADHCTIMRHSQCLTPHHLENCGEELDVGKLPQLIQLQVKTGHSSHIWDQSISYEYCMFIIYTVWEDFKTGTAGGFVCFTP